MQTCRLDQVCEITMGQAPSGDAYNDDGEGWPLIAGAGDFGNLYPSPKKFTREASRVSRAGDIVLGIRASIGEKVLADGEYCLGRGVASFRTRSELDTRYLWHWLTHIQPVLASKARGATFLQVNKNDIAELEIKLPPIAEQRRIAAILDQSDAIGAKRREALALLDTMARCLFIDSFGDPIANHRGWTVRQLEQVCDKITDGTHKTPVYVAEGVEFLSAKDIKEGRILWGSNKFISESEHTQLVKRCDPALGDIVLAKSGSLGAVAIIDRDHEFSLFESLCLIKYKRDLVDGVFLSSLLSNESMQAHLIGKNKGIAIKHLHLIDIRGIAIPVPPLPQQRSFATRIRAIESLKATHRAALAESDALFAALQHRAFTGQFS